ncbi:MAG: hypothetical protein MRZ79_06775 [Bacteroidia bacterium]|nr:hypothetical protein [Bacteroidia bacterium]
MKHIILSLTIFLLTACTEQLTSLSEELGGKFSVAHEYRNGVNLIGRDIQTKEWEFIPTDDNSGELIQTTIDNFGLTWIEKGTYRVSSDQNTPEGYYSSIHITLEHDTLQNHSIQYTRRRGTQEFEQDEFWMYFFDETEYTFDMRAFRIE